MSLLKILVGTSLVGSLSLASCVREVIVEPENSSQTAQATLKYLGFRITYGNPPRGGVFGVSVYDQNTRVRQELGSSLPSGDYITGSKMDSSKKYRVEIHTYPDRVCVMAFWDLSQSTTPELWKDNKSDKLIDGAHLGATPIPAQGCWGP